MRWAFGEDYYDMLHSLFGDVSKLRGSDKDYKGLIKRLKEQNADIPKIYMACGESDFILERTRDYHKFLLNEDVEHTYEEGPGAHDWVFWDTFIKKFVDWLPLDENAVAGKHSGNVHALNVKIK